MKYNDIYVKAIHAIEEKGWHQGSMHGPDGSVCLSGALHSAAGVSDNSDSILLTEAGQLWGRAVQALAVQMGKTPGELVDWNDNPHTTREDVILALKKAASEC